MEFAILGPLEVRDQHRRIEVSSAKERLLLAALVVRPNEVISADRLIEVLWGAEPPGTAVNTLQTYVSHLRRTLEPGRSPRSQDGVLRTRGQGYELTIPPEAVDAVRFERLAYAGRDLLSSAPERAAEILRAAIALWRGEPLGEFRFELFAQSEIVRLTELHAAVQEDRMEADLALGRHAALCGELSRAVVEHPLRERLWSQLIRALYRSGRQADALAAYARLREQLAESLGIDPSPELVRLHEAVLAQRPYLDWSPPPRSTGVPSLPVELRTTEQLLPEARAALAAYDWQRAFDLFTRAEKVAPLAAADLDGLAQAAYWSAHPRAALSAQQRAHDAHAWAGDHRQAGLAAITLTLWYSGFRQFAVASGWFQRAQRLLAAEPGSVEHGYVAWGAMMFALRADDHEQCLVTTRLMCEIGQRHGVADLHAVGLVFQGGVLIRRGQPEEGLAMHDEGMAMAVGGELSQLATVQVFCQVVRTCNELGDYRRAREWNEAIEDCFQRTGLNAFPGDCETHRIAILINRGAWVLAEQSAHRACASSQRFDPAHAGLAFIGIGEIRLRTGDLATAEEAFRKAQELGVSALPGLAQLEMRRGHPAQAAALINEGLTGEGWDRLDRCRLLPDQVSFALAVGDLDTARAAVTELVASAQLYGSKVMLASAYRARGELALVTGEECPLAPLRRSVELWREAEVPYESARTRVLLATALDRAGRGEETRMELAAARACFERLGARLDAEAVAELLGPTQARARS